MATAIHEARVGLIKAKVLRRGKRVPAVYTVSAVRLYRDGRVWKESTRFALEDLPALRLALDMAYEWMLLHREETARVAASREAGHTRSKRGSTAATRDLHLG